MGLDRVRPWCAIIAASQDIAAQYIAAFGLSPEIWTAIRHDAATAGQQFERVVVIRPHWQMDQDEAARFEQQIIDQWRALVAPGGWLTII
ncbi:hypothetical protein ACTG4Q_20730 [Bradyrhizobium denitrificans]